MRVAGGAAGYTSSWATGGAREGAGAGTSTGRARCVRMRRATADASIRAIKRSRPPPLTRERDQPLDAAGAAAKPGESAGKPPTGQKRVKLLLDKARHALAVAQVRGLGKNVCR